MNEEDHRTVEAMERYGGSFVQHLATLARCADPINFALIKKTWPAYWRQYKKLGNKI
jgi:hypothetical protein